MERWVVTSHMEYKTLMANNFMSSCSFLMNYGSIYSICLDLSEYIIENLLMPISH